jgi:hypothetical protein
MFTTIRHQMWHDARALRAPLAAWVGILALQIGVVVVGPSATGTGGDGSGLNAWMGAVVIRLAMTVILTALLIQRDPAVGTTAFWMTRPIRPAAMWGAKLIAIISWCLLLPAIVAWQTFVALGLDGANALRAAGQLAIEQVFVVSLALTLASVTATLAHLIVAGLVGYVAVGILTQAARAVRLALPQVTLSGPNAIVYVWLAAIVLGAIAVSAHQYLTRRRARTLAVAALALLAAQAPFLVVRNTPAWDPAIWSDRRYVPTTEVGLRIEGGAAESEYVSLSRSSDAPDGVRALGAILITPPPQGEIAIEPLFVESSLTTTPAEPVSTLAWSNPSRRGVWSGSRSASLDDPPWRGIRLALDVDTLLLPALPTALTFRTLLAEWPETNWRVLARNGGGQLRATVWLKAYRYRVGAGLRLHPGASYAPGDRRMTITSVEPTTKGIAVTLRTAFLSSGEAKVAQQGGTLYVLRNPSRRQAILVTDEQTSNTRLTIGIGVWNPGTGVRRLEYDSRGVTGRVAMTSDWIAGAQLVVLVPEDLGVFTRSVEAVVVAPGGVLR